MKLSIISFTRNGIRLSQKLLHKLVEADVSLFTKCSNAGTENEESPISGVENKERTPVYVEKSISEWTKTQMEEGCALVFIGACGIAVRAIAPCLANKLSDSPVLVMDEHGTYVIPILSGHMGGANEIAAYIAKNTNAEAVITTATDINGKFAVDLFAKKNNLVIVNKDGIAKVSSKVLADKELSIAIEPGHLRKESCMPSYLHLISYPPKQPVDIVITSEDKAFETSLLLKPRAYVIGMGCRRGKETVKIEELIHSSLSNLFIDVTQVSALASIDLKEEEEGFLMWSQKEKIPFLTYTAEQLKETEGNFSKSAFVETKVGVDNVCERAALKACGARGILVLKKQAQDGMTIAVAKREWSVTFDEE